MSAIVMGLGTSQNSLVSIPGRYWPLRGKIDIERDRFFRPDGSPVTYGQLAAEAGDRFNGLLTEAHLDDLTRLIRAAQERLAEEVARARLDVLVVVGDDQAELLEKSNTPAVAIYNGAELANHTMRLTEFPEWQRRWREAAALAPERHYPGAPEFADELIARLIEREVDVAVVSQPASAKRGIGHAWAFVANRLIVGRPVPIVPVIVNTWYPPNVPTPARCFGIGAAIRAAIEEIPGDLRVGIAAAGGLSHTLVNEELDRRVLAALRDGDVDVLTTLPRTALLGGSGQIRDWIVMAGAVAGLRNQWMEYFPAYRTPGGTGAGLAFAAWS